MTREETSAIRALERLAMCWPLSLVLAGVRPSPRAVPSRGALGLWRLPEDVEKAARAPLEESADA